MVSRHKFEPDLAGRCTGGWWNNAGRFIHCHASRWSVLHDDAEADCRQRHDHGGGDCMCFEDTRAPVDWPALNDDSWSRASGQ